MTDKNDVHHAAIAPNPRCCGGFCPVGIWRLILVLGDHKPKLKTWPGWSPHLWGLGANKQGLEKLFSCILILFIVDIFMNKCLSIVSWTWVYLSKWLTWMTRKAQLLPPYPRSRGLLPRGIWRLILVLGDHKPKLKTWPGWSPHLWGLGAGKQGLEKLLSCILILFIADTFKNKCLSIVSWTWHDSISWKKSITSK